MSRCTLAGLFLLAAGLAFAQLDNNTVTVTASRNANPEPDQAVFYISVGSGLSTTFGDVLAALQGSGITLANFSSVSGSTSIFPLPDDVLALPPRIEWAFRLTVPLGSTKDTTAALTRLQQSIAQSNNGLRLLFQLLQTEVSLQARQSPPCVWTDLIADARAQSQKTAASAGLNVLSIVSMSGSTSTCSATVTFGQATSKSVTVTASQQTNVTPDQVVFVVTVNSPLTIGLDDVIVALRGSGIAAANLSSVSTQTAYTSPTRQQSLAWTFVLPVFFGSMQDTVASLTNLQKAIAQQKTGLVLSFGPQGTQVSAQARQAQQCSTAGLIADAQAQAQKLADAARLILGPILAISEASLSPTGVLGAQIPTALAFVPGEHFGTITWFTPPIPTTCSLVVKFALFGG